MTGFNIPLKRRAETPMYDLTVTILPCTQAVSPRSASSEETIAIHGHNFGYWIQVNSAAEPSLSARPLLDVHDACPTRRSAGTGLSWYLRGRRARATGWQHQHRRHHDACTLPPVGPKRCEKPGRAVCRSDLNGKGKVVAKSLQVEAYILKSW